MDEDIVIFSKPIKDCPEWALWECLACESSFLGGLSVERPLELPVSEGKVCAFCNGIAYFQHVLTLAMKKIWVHEPVGLQWIDVPWSVWDTFPYKGEQ